MNLNLTSLAIIGLGAGISYILLSSSNNNNNNIISLFPTSISTTTPLPSKDARKRGAGVTTDAGVEISPTITPLSYLPAGFLSPKTNAEQAAHAQDLLNKARSESYPPLSSTQIQEAIRDVYSKYQLEEGERYVYDYPGFRRGSGGLLYWDGVTIPEDLIGVIDTVRKLPSDCNQVADAEGGAAYCQWRKENYRIEMEKLRRPHWPGTDISAVVAPMASKVHGMKQQEMANCNPAKLVQLPLEHKIVMQRYCEQRMGTTRRKTITTRTPTGRRVQRNPTTGPNLGGILSSILGNFNKQVQESRKPRPIYTALEWDRMIAYHNARKAEGDIREDTWLKAGRQYSAYKRTLDKGESERVSSTYASALYGSSFRRRRQGGA